MVCTDVLEHIEPECLDPALGAAFFMSACQAQEINCRSGPDWEAFKAAAAVHQRPFNCVNDREHFIASFNAIEPRSNIAVLAFIGVMFIESRNAVLLAFVYPDGTRYAVIDIPNFQAVIEGASQ